MEWIYLWPVLLIITGYLLKHVFTAQTARILAWLLAGCNTYLTYKYSLNLSGPVLRMIILVTGLFLSMKVVSYTFSPYRLEFRQWIMFCFLWIGMNPGFLLNKKEENLISKTTLISSSVNLFTGFLLLYFANQITPIGLYYLPKWVLSLVGLSMVFHFGIINLIAQLWQWYGYPVKAAFLSPLKTKNIIQFWGKEWNKPFVEMTSICFYRPLVHLTWKNTAMFATFVLSGVFHEIAITLPVHSGFGRPLLYFVIQGAAVLFEKKLTNDNFNAKRNWIVRIFSYIVLILPLPLLFPPAFSHEILFAIICKLFSFL